MSGCGKLATVNGPGWAYDPTQGREVGWYGGNTAYLYNPDTDSCTPQTYAGGPPGGSAISCDDGNGQQCEGTYGRFRYFPALGVFILVNDISQNAYSLRLTSAGGSGPSGPVISSVGTSGITTTGGTVTWTTDVGATTQVEYGTTTSYGTLTTLNSSLVTSHSVALTGLSLGTLYHYRAHSKNSGGVESISGDFAFATNNTTDNTPPTISLTAPTNGATISGAVSVSATASDNVGVASVQFVLDGSALGVSVTSAPYSVSWNTTTASNGAHILTAQAKDAAGNVSTSASVSVTVSNTASSADQDFTNRCTAAGVLACQGFDSASAFAQASSPASGFYYQGAGSCPTWPTACIQEDTSVFLSGGSSARWDIPTTGNSNAEGNYFQSFCGASACTSSGQAGVMGQNKTFYLQFAFRVDSNWLQNWENCCGSSPKIDIIHGVQAGGESNTCSTSEELTTNNVGGTGSPMMYTDCGGRALWTLTDGVTPNMGGNSNGYLIEQGAYSCENYKNGVAGPPYTGNCFVPVAGQWYTIYEKIQVGTWGQPNSSVQAWIGPYGSPLLKFINLINFPLSDDTSNSPDGFSAITLTQYMTNKTAGGTAAHVWYDELIISTNPIAAPGGQTVGP